MKARGRSPGWSTRPFSSDLSIAAASSPMQPEPTAKASVSVTRTRRTAAEGRGRDLSELADGRKRRGERIVFHRGKRHVLEAGEVDVVVDDSLVAVEREASLVAIRAFDRHFVESFEQLGLVFSAAGL